MTTASQPSDKEIIHQLRAELEQSQALAAIGELTGTTAHEFNNVLMTILNYAKLGLRHKDEPTRDKALNRIHDAAQRAAKISRTILTTAQNRGEELEPTDLSAIVSDSLTLLEREMRKYRIDVQTQLSESAIAIANGNQIQRILLNLLINARQAMPETGGSIMISVAPEIESGEVVLTVRDTGTGIPQEHLPHIFDPFFSTKKGPDSTGKGGTGIGLASCRDIIQKHGGRIRVESTVGKGTAFIIRLPAAGGDNSAAA